MRLALGVENFHAAITVATRTTSISRRISQNPSSIHGQNLDHWQRKGLEMTGFRTKGLLVRFQIPRCRNEHKSDR